MSSPEHPVSVPNEIVLAATQRQRNNALDENAALWAHVEQLTAERDQLATELARVRGEAPVVGGQAVSDAGS